MSSLGEYTFTTALINELVRSSQGPPSTVQTLFENLTALVEARHAVEQSSLQNGARKSDSPAPRMPITFNLTPPTSQTITLAVMPAKSPTTAHLAQPVISSDFDMRNAMVDPAMLRSPTGAPYGHQLFEEPRALVSIAFEGGDGHDMTALQSWLQSIPTAGAAITVEGIFHGSMTTMLITMPFDLWAVLQTDRACVFLGRVMSHNILGEYKNVVTVNTRVSPRELEDGKILLQVAEAAMASPGIARRSSEVPAIPVLSPGYPKAATAVMLDRKPEVEDSAEMHEAAEQLKALSHVRHDRPSSSDGNGHPGAAEDVGSRRSQHGESRSMSHESGDSNDEDGLYNAELDSPASRPKARRSINRQGPKQDTRCSLCSHTPFKDTSSLRKHIAAAHTRPFPCAFAFAGCTSTFGSKNEWKRHIASQHLCLTYYRCSSCSQGTVEGKGNEFNRKDLFTQHLRRMHAPFQIKRALAKGDSKLQQEWESHVKDMQISCLVTRRAPPQRSACPKADCANIFEGAGSWDDWTEHVGRHMEKGEAARLGVDRLLAKWALDEGIIEKKDDGEYRLCGVEREGGAAGYYSESVAKEEGDGGNGYLVDDGGMGHGGMNGGMIM